MLLSVNNFRFFKHWSLVGPDEVRKAGWTVKLAVCSAKKKTEEMMKWSSNDFTTIPLPFTFCHQTDKSECRNEVGRIDYAGLIKDNELFWKSEDRRRRSTKEDERVWRRRWGKRDGKVLIMQPQFCCPIKYKIFSLCTLCLVAQMTADQSWCISEHVCVCACAGRVEQQSPSGAVTPSQWSQNPKTDKSSCDVNSAI